MARILAIPPDLAGAQAGTGLSALAGLAGAPDMGQQAFPQPALPGCLTVIGEGGWSEMPK